jgi:hypothetical protein
MMSVMSAQSTAMNEPAASATRTIPTMPTSMTGATTRIPMPAAPTAQDP